MSEIKINVNAAISVIDGFTGKKIKENTVSVKTENGFHAVKKTDGYFVFVNCSAGKYRIIVESEQYQRKTFDLLFGNDFVTASVELNPNRKYKFDGNTIRLYGKLENGKTVKAAFFCENPKYRIMEEYEKGSIELRIFSNENKNAYPEQIMLTDSKSIYDIYTLKRVGFMKYAADKPLKHSFTSDMDICEVFEITGDENNEYFFALNRMCRKIAFIDGVKTTIEEINKNCLNFDF